MKKNFIHFFFFSLLMTAPYAASSAAPDTGDFPPLPPDRAMPGEDFDKENFPKPDSSELRRPPRPEKNPENIMNYRGSRTYAEDLPLKITQTKCFCKDDMVSLIIIFNQNINPRSLHRDSILINNMPIPLGSRFAFSKRGNTIRILLPKQETSFKLKVQNISSFNGSLLEPVEILTEIER